MSVHQDTERLLSAYLDGELTQAEDQRVRIHLEDCVECRARLGELSRLREAASGLRFVDPPEDRMNELEQQVSVRVPRGIGWALLVTGALVWAAYAAWLFVTAPDLATWEKLTTAAMVIGVVMLLVSVGRQRWLERRSDRYRRVER